jgi:hypothetical protein
MKIELSFAHLHSPLFFANKNWGEKLDTKNTSKGSISLIYDRTEKELLIKSGIHESIIPLSNVVSMTPKTGAPTDMIPPKGPAPSGKIKAQASSPVEHVQAGPGFGKTND